MNYLESPRQITNSDMEKSIHNGNKLSKSEVQNFIMESLNMHPLQKESNEEFGLEMNTFNPLEMIHEKSDSIEISLGIGE